jgi:hypothetical protein
MPISPYEAKEAEKKWRKRELDELLKLMFGRVDTALSKGDRRDICVHATCLPGWDDERLKKAGIRSCKIKQLFAYAYSSVGWDLDIWDHGHSGFRLCFRTRELAPLEQLAQVAE